MNSIVEEEENFTDDNEDSSDEGFEEIEEEDSNLSHSTKNY